MTAPHSRLAGSGCGIPTVFVSATHDAGHQPPRGQLQQLWRRRLDLGILLSRQGFSGSPRPTSTRNKEFARQYLAGEVEVELAPEGTLAERLAREGPAHRRSTPATGVGTQIVEGISVEVCRWRHDRGGLPFQGDSRGRVDKEPRTFVLEAIVADFGLSGQPRVTVTATWPSTSRPATSTSSRRWLAK